MSKSRPDLSVLRAAAPFAGYDERALAPLAAHADRLDPRPGTPLARAGEHAREVVVVVEGDAVVMHRGGVARLGPGSWVGAREVVGGHAHGETVVAGDGLRVVVLPAPAFRWAAQMLPGLLDQVAAPGDPAPVTASRAA
ncbi:MAG TPA: cyclic nucleotide-binding domain-containing protein [Acidimicrobiales bacterium]